MRWRVCSQKRHGRVVRGEPEFPSMASAWRRAFLYDEVCPDVDHWAEPEGEGEEEDTPSVGRPGRGRQVRG